MSYNMRYITLKRIMQRFCFIVSNFPMSGHGVRPQIVRWGGVKILEPMTCLTCPDLGLQE